MMYIKTNKELKTSVHNNDTSIVRFDYTYYRPYNDSLKIVVSAYDSEGSLLPQGCKTMTLSGDDLLSVLTVAKTITEHNVNPLLYMDALVASGIKIVIASGGYWQDELDVEDFE